MQNQGTQGIDSSAPGTAPLDCRAAAMVSIAKPVDQHATNPNPNKRSHQGLGPNGHKVGTGSPQGPPTAAKTFTRNKNRTIQGRTVRQAGTKTIATKPSRAAHPYSALHRSSNTGSSACFGVRDRDENTIIGRGA
jgi:hypothetical protein